jgi:uncharacterized protein DUF6675
MLRLLVAALCIGLPVTAVAGPVPPCGGLPPPSFGELDGPPQWRIWSADELQAERWRPADCLGWPGSTKLVAAVSSRFRSSSDVFQRLVDIGAWPGIRYWSVSKQSWQPLALTVSALGVSGQPPGGLLVASGLATGEAYQFTERDENSGDTTYRLRVLRHDRDHLVVATDNVSPIRIAIIKAFDPAALQTVTFVEQTAAGTWSTYQITRVGAGASSLVLRYQGSFLNRLEAVRRYLAGQPEAGQPPLAPR